MSNWDEKRYKVFVSSTFTDLRAEREQVLQALLEMRAFPAGMELFPSADEEQWEFIRREIESSDYYIVIVAGRYGSLGPDGLSFTEMEYDHAVSLKKPVMGFLHEDPASIASRDSEQDPRRREKLEAFREKVRARRLVRFYSTPEELKALVWQALSHAMQMQPQIGWLRGNLARRHEDLEEINLLQKKVRELGEEVTRLRAAGAEEQRALACGGELVELEVKLSDIEIGDRKANVPQPVVKVAATWDDIFLAIFSHPEPHVGDYAVSRRITGFIASRILEYSLLPDGPWLDCLREWSSTDSTYWMSDESEKKIEANIGIQLEGLGLMRIESETVTETWQPPHLTRDFSPGVQSRRYAEIKWKLTERGLLHRAMLRGHRKPDLALAPELTSRPSRTPG